MNQGPKGERERQDDPPDFYGINILATTSGWIYHPNKELDIGFNIEFLSPRHISSMLSGSNLKDTPILSLDPLPGNNHSR